MHVCDVFYILHLHKHGILTIRIRYKIWEYIVYIMIMIEYDPMEIVSL